MFVVTLLVSSPAVSAQDWPTPQAQARQAERQKRKPTYTTRDVERHRQKVQHQRERDTQRLAEERRLHQQIQQTAFEGVSDSAQWRPYRGPGNWFIGIDVGASLPLNENVHYGDAFSTRGPSFSMQLGRTLHPCWSLRLTAGLYPQLGRVAKSIKVYAPDLMSDYRFFVAGFTGDVMFNLSNACRTYHPDEWFDFYIIAGGGVIHRFGFDDKVRLPDYQDLYPVDYSAKWFWTARAGFMAAWHVSQKLDINLEWDVHSTDNAYNGVVDDVSHRIDFFTSIRLGTTYYFRNAKGRHRYGKAPYVYKHWKF